MRIQWDAGRYPKEPPGQGRRAPPLHPPELAAPLDSRGVAFVRGRARSPAACTRAVERAPNLGVRGVARVRFVWHGRRARALSVVKAAALGLCYAPSISCGNTAAVCVRISGTNDARSAFGGLGGRPDACCVIFESRGDRRGRHMTLKPRSRRIRYIGAAAYRRERCPGVASAALRCWHGAR